MDENYDYVTKNHYGVLVSTHPYFKAFAALPERGLLALTKALFRNANTHATRQEWDRTAEFINKFNNIFEQHVIWTCSIMCSNAEAIDKLLDACGTLKEIQSALKRDNNGKSCITALQRATKDTMVWYKTYYLVDADLAEFFMDSVKYAEGFEYRESMELYNALKRE